MFIGCPPDTTRSRARPAASSPASRAMVVDEDGQEVPRGHRRPARGDGPDRVPLSGRPREPAEVRAARLEPDRRCVPAGRRRLLLVPGADGRHDHLVRLQRVRRGSGERAAGAPAVAECAVVGVPDEARGQHRQGVRRAGRWRRRVRTTLARELQEFVKSRARALQVSARDRVRDGAAADADGQAAAIPAAAEATRRRRNAEAGARLAFHQPDGWARPVGYANAVSATGRVVFIAGQVGWNPVTSRFEADDLCGQVRQALSECRRRARRRRRAAGSDHAADLVHHRPRSVSVEAGGDRPRVSRNHRPSLSGDVDGGRQRAHGARGAGGDRGHGGSERERVNTCEIIRTRRGFVRAAR